MASLILICVISVAYVAGMERGKKPIRDYQIDLHMDTVWLYDGERLVGRFTNTRYDSQLDSLILKDNL
jgi:hypothetical protein